MYLYAKLNNENICENVFEYSQELENSPGHLVPISSAIRDKVRWSKYENGQWSMEKFPPAELPKQETLEEKVDRLEQQILQDNLATFEVLATIYEELITGGV